MKSFYKIFIVSIFIGLMFFGANAQSLKGEWKLVKAKADGERVVYESEIKTNIAFSEENRMFGNSGCNRYSTTYTLEGKKSIEIEPIISTKMACLEGDLMKQENTFFNVISKAENYRIKENYLIFFDESRNNVLKFMRVSEQNS